MTQTREKVRKIIRHAFIQDPSCNYYLEDNTREGTYLDQATDKIMEAVRLGEEELINILFKVDMESKASSPEGKRQDVAQAILKAQKDE